MESRLQRLKDRFFAAAYLCNHGMNFEIHSSRIKSIDSSVNSLIISPLKRIDSNGGLYPFRGRDSTAQRHSPLSP